MDTDTPLARIIAGAMPETVFSEGMQDHGFILPGFSKIPAWHRRIYLHGKNAVTLAEGIKPAVQYRSVFNAKSLAAGIYTCLLRTDDSVYTRKLS
jgi:hypothetical protein